MPLATPAGLEAEFETRLRAELQRRTAVTPAMFHSIDEKGRLISVSDVWLAKLGYSRDGPLRKRPVPDGAQGRRRHRRPAVGGPRQ